MVDEGYPLANALGSSQAVKGLVSPGRPLHRSSEPLKALKNLENIKDDHESLGSPASNDFLASIFEFRF